MQDLGKLLLRLAVGGLMLFHGIHKLMHHERTLKGMEGALAGKGLPEFLAWGVYAGEVLAPALLIVGFFTRIAALAVAGTMGMALYLVHMEDFGKINEMSGGWGVELAMFYLLTSLAIACLGSGRFGVDGRLKRLG